MRIWIAALAAAACSASSFSVALGAADQAEAGYHYTYHKQITPLALDATRIAVQAEDVGALKGALAAVKLEGATVTPHEFNGWYLIGELGKADAARIEQLVAALAAQPAVKFASPVFVDLFGGPMFPMQDLLVGFAPGQNAGDHDALVDGVIAVQARERNWMPDVDRLTVLSRNGFDVLNASNTLGALPKTLFAEPNMMFTGKHHLIPNDPMFSDLWGLNNTGQSGGLFNSDMNIVEAWDITAGSSAIIDVVIDVGVDQTHPDLNLFTPGNDLTGNGTAGAPGNACDNHGTAVAGCISARINNSLGVVGAAPGCRVASARCFVSNLSCNGSWSGNATATVNALNWAQSIGARVTNNSNGYGFTAASIDTAYANTRAAGIIHFASAGNDGTSFLGYPASLPSIDAVAAMDRFGNRAGFSQFGTNLAWCAPGVSVGSTDRQGAAGYSGNDYNVVDGTSFASPYASAVACLILSRNSSLNVAQVESVMQNSVRDLGPAGYDTGYGYGYVNAQGALNLLVPAGDGCSSAVNVSTGVFSNTLVGATNPSPVASCGAADGNPDVWYRFVAPTAGTLTASTCGTSDTGGVDLGVDTVLSLHAACNSGALACSDDGAGCGAADAGSLRDSLLTRPMSAGEAILIRVSKWSASALGPITLNIGFTAANDTCAGAFDVSSGGTFFGNIAYTNNETNFTTMCGAAQTNPDAWYFFTAPATCPVLLTASTCGTHDAAGLNTGMDTVISLHTACGAEPVSCNDDSGSCGSLDTGVFRDSLVTRSLAPGETVYIRVSKFGSAVNGPFRLNISAAPANDACANAQPINAGVATLFCSQGATTDGPTETACDNAGDNGVGNDLWYRYTTHGAGRFTVRTCGSSFDTKVALYGNTCPVPSAPNTAIACNDDAGAACPSSGVNSTVTALGAANTSYLIRVGGYFGATGAGVVTVYCAADINFSGTVSVQDIFDFLTLYFANDPRADINGSGTISVQDIFDFLAAYFAGCA